MRNTTPIFLAGFLAMFAASAFGATPLDGPPSGKQWRLVFSDEFDGSTLDEPSQPGRCGPAA